MGVSVKRRPADGPAPPRAADAPWAPVVAPVEAPSSGYVVALHGLGVGRAAVRLGAGRSRKEDPVDHATGVVCRAKRGDRVRAGEPLAEVHARNQGEAERAAVEVAACYEVGSEPPSPAPLVLEVIE